MSSSQSTSATTGPSGPGRNAAGDAAVATPDLSLHEMLRVMDVARELRQGRERAEQVLARDDLRAALREKLMRTALLSGDRVTAAEIDVAIDTYFANQHQYQDPAFSLPVALAYLWVWRVRLLVSLTTMLLTVALVWGLWFSPVAPFSSRVQQQRQAAAVEEQATNLLAQIRAISIEPAAVDEAVRLTAQIEAAGANDPAAALSAAAKLRALHQTLTTSYTVRITPDAEGTHLFEVRQSDGRLSGYYAVVSALDDAGTPIPQAIRNAETDQIETVTQWAERISPIAFERLAEDKTSDGVLDEVIFAVKPRGQRGWEMRLEDAEGQLLQRSVQITRW